MIDYDYNPFEYTSEMLNTFSPVQVLSVKQVLPVVLNPQTATKAPELFRDCNSVVVRI